MADTPEEQDPIFTVEVKKNAWGIYGPLLCWPDGSIVPSQKSCTLHNPAPDQVEEIPTVTVTFHCGAGTVKVLGPEEIIERDKMMEEFGETGP